MVLGLIWYTFGDTASQTSSVQSDGRGVTVVDRLNENVYGSAVHGYSVTLPVDWFLDPTSNSDTLSFLDATAVRTVGFDDQQFRGTKIEVRAEKQSSLGFDQYTQEQLQKMSEGVSSRSKVTVDERGADQIIFQKTALTIIEIDEGRYLTITGLFGDADTLQKSITAYKRIVQTITFQNP